MWADAIALAYILFIALISLVVLLHFPSRSTYRLNASPTLVPLSLTASGLLISATEIGLGLIPLNNLTSTSAFIIVLTRKVLLLISRSILVGGLIWAYRSAEDRRKRRSGTFVGGPIRGTFRRLSMTGTREFRAVHGCGRELGQDGMVQPERAFFTSVSQYIPATSFVPSRQLAQKGSRISRQGLSLQGSVSPRLHLHPSPRPRPSDSHLHHHPARLYRHDPANLAHYLGPRRTSGRSMLLRGSRSTRLTWRNGRHRPLGRRAGLCPRGHCIRKEGRDRLDTGWGQRSGQVRETQSILSCRQLRLSYYLSGRRLAPLLTLRLDHHRHVRISLSQRAYLQPHRISRILRPCPFHNKAARLPNNPVLPSQHRHSAVFHPTVPATRQSIQARLTQ